MPDFEKLETLQDALSSFDTRPDLFNQYISYTQYDVGDAPSIRLSNVIAYLERFVGRRQTLILAEAPGPWGCRFTGIPITSEEEIGRSEFPIKATICTQGPPRKEYSSGIFWRVLESHHERFFTWNAVPFHPHKVGMTDSIRTPTITELRECAVITRLVLDICVPSRILALGRRAEKQLTILGAEAEYIRHPSQGGAKAFEKGMRDAFRTRKA
ncbi:MAG: uracil-DNA glycosylase [Rhodothermales bacterium]|nr:uracil-DNA glycosylase [Rhodothermales bacterium]